MYEAATPFDGALPEFQSATRSYSGRSTAVDPFVWPSFGYVDDVRAFVGQAVAQGKPMVLATLVRVEGGGPRPVGAQMAFTNTDLVGFLSGGCVEADVATQAAQVLASGTPRKLVYGRGSPYFDIQLLCGARIELMLERVSPSDDAVIRLLELTKARRSALWLSNGRDHHCLAEDEPAPKGWKELAKHGRLVLEAAGETPGAYWIRFRPTIRTYVMGRDPTSMAAAMLSAQVGFETILVRPGGPSERPPFEIQHYWRGDIDSALAKFGATTGPQSSSPITILKSTMLRLAPRWRLLQGMWASLDRVATRMPAFNDCGQPARAINN